MPNTFMATAVDLGAYEGGCGKDTYPALCIHPGYKAAVGERLARGAMNVAFGDKTSYHSGPIFASAANSAGGTVVVQFRDVGTGGVSVRETTGFELSADGKTWESALVVSHTNTSVTLSGLAGGGAATEARYLWSSIPCTHPVRKLLVGMRLTFFSLSLFKDR